MTEHIQRHHYQQLTWLKNDEVCQCIYNRMRDEVTTGVPGYMIQIGDTIEIKDEGQFEILEWCCEDIRRESLRLRVRSVAVA